MQSLDKLIPFGKTLYPSETEFRDFRAYVNKLSTRPEYHNVGAIRVVPPASFRSESLWKPEMIDKLQVVSPIEQQVFERNELYELRLISRRSRGLREYKELVDRCEREYKIPRDATTEDYEKMVV